MSFSPYQSIKNHTHNQTLDLVSTLDLHDDSIEWIATEKIHGSNFSFICNGESIRCGRRKAILEEDESFYNWRALRDKYADQIMLIYTELVEQFPGTEIVTIYGELYGGAYPHDDVEQVSGVKAVQNGVWYRPDVDFYPFDIMVGQDFVSFDVFSECCKGRFISAQILHRGTYAECMAFDVEFTSLIPQLLNLPIIESNIAEGIVLKPVIPVVSEEGDRVIIKKKHPKFEEVAYTPKPKKKPAAKKTVQVPEEAEQLMDLLDGYFTDNRLRNVISKETEIEDSKSAKANLTKLFKEDAWKDFTDDHPEVNSLAGNSKKHVMIHLNKSAPQVVSNNWDAIIEGTF